MKTALSILISAVLVTSFVAAAGTSTGGAPGNTGENAQAKGPDMANNSTNKTTPVATGALNETSCETGLTIKERVLCRLQADEEPAPVVEESCRGVPDPTGCQQLYGKSDICYKETGKAKDACFKRVIGFSNSAVRAEASKSQANVRQYIVLLLYDVQERIEAANEAGDVTDEDAALLIEKIVTTKQAIQNGAAKENLRAAIAELKTSYAEVMQ